MGYGKFIFENYRFLLFGFVLVFVGNYGQTFFISVFGGEWRDSFSLSNTEYSAYYSIATLISGFTLMLIGGKLDTSSLKTFTLWVLFGTFIATMVLAFAVNEYWLFAGFLLIRFCGQGLTGHTSFTTMARYFDKNRGKAISVASMGMPLGEFILPILAAIAIAYLGWREVWMGLAVVLIVLFLPLLLWTLGDERAKHPISQSSTPESEADNIKHWERRDVIRDGRFWLTIPAILAPAMLITGLFFHQVAWAEGRGWSLSAIASSMTLYAITHALGSLFTGALVDRWGAKRVMRVYLIPLTLGISCLIFDSLFGWIAFMFLSGFSVGASGPTIGSLWPEVYGTRHLGSIRSLVSALMVISTAIAPIVLGALIDFKIDIAFIMVGCMAYSLFAWLICQRVYQS
ncbi:MFS transporter [Pleionea sediminis]|uniref:MFS transporter n=1 Tax=Pleionea sediminis TaxID=2569479 RepID=UPI0013DDCBC1|nr:MFS transporter [Pleionea sediminis]